MRQTNNILLITFDQMRGDWIQEKNRIIDLPNIFKLARQGRNYEKCYTNSPQCVPARLSWITGKNPSTLGITTNQNVDINNSASSIILDLQKKGWTTSLIGKTHWTRHEAGKDLKNNEILMHEIGFDNILEICGPRALAKVKCVLTEEWEKIGMLDIYKQDMKKRYGSGRTKNTWEARETVLPNEYYPDIWIANRAIEKLKFLKQTKPWFLWISFVGPHEPFDTPQPWSLLGHKIESSIAESEWINELKDTNSLKRQARKWSNTFTSQEAIEFRDNYAANLILLDEQVGRICNALSLRADEGRTTIAITSDHGEMLGDHGLLYKSTFLEPSINVPFIVYEPKENQDIQTRASTNPFNTTQALKALINGHSKGLGTSKLKNYVAKSKEAIIEYEDEICYVGNKYKIMLNQFGEAEWAIDLEKDKQEIRNLISENLTPKEETMIDNQIRKAKLKWAKRKRNQGRYSHYISKY